MISLTRSDATTITVDAEFGKNDKGALKYGKIKLLQEAKTVEFDAGKYSLSMVLKEKFDVSKSLYILVENSEGHSIKKKLQIELDSKIAGIDGGFSLGSKAGFTLPEDWPVIGNSKLSLDLVQKVLPLSVTVDDGKVYFTLGVDIVKYTETDKYASTRDKTKTAHVLKEETKWLFENLKKAKNAKSYMDQIKSIKQKYKNAVKYPQGSVGFEADFTILGYGEGYIDENGEFKFLDGGVILCPTRGGSV